VGQEQVNLTEDKGYYTAKLVLGGVTLPDSYDAAFVRQVADSCLAAEVRESV